MTVPFIPSIEGSTSRISGFWEVPEHETSSQRYLLPQVVDARDPLRYWSPDLQTYAAELSPSKPSLMLLNKADLLPHHVRCQWADYLDQQGIDYLFWSAKAATAAATAAAAGGKASPCFCVGPIRRCCDSVSSDSSSTCSIVVTREPALKLRQVSLHVLVTTAFWADGRA